MERKQYVDALRKLQTKPDVEIVGMRAELFNEIIDHTVMLFEAMQIFDGTPTGGFVIREVLNKSAHISAHADQ